MAGARRNVAGNGLGFPVARCCTTFEKHCAQERVLADIIMRYSTGQKVPN